MTAFSKTPRLRRSAALGAVLGLPVLPALAADITLKIEIPRLPVAEYHRPYVAVWLERANEANAAAQLAVWYDLKKKDNGGAKWLKDMRQWWRKGGRDLTVPADGVSGATRAPGEAVLNLGNHKALSNLPAGSYQLVVEAARENGGREVLRLPLQWPPKAAQTEKAQGEGELGAVQLSVKP